MQKLFLYTNLKPEHSQKPATPTPPRHTWDEASAKVRNKHHMCYVWVVNIA